MKNKNQSNEILITLCRFLSPIFYLFAWIILLWLARNLLGDNILSNWMFMIISLAIMFIGIISRSTSWSIFGDKGIKGDSLGRYVDFHSGGNPPWDYKIFISDEEKAKNKLEFSEKIVEKINMKVVENEKTKTPDKTV